MSNSINGRIQTKPVREAYVDQSPYNQNKKRKSLTRLHSLDDSDIAHRSTPEYLKQLMNTSHSARSIKRTNSASEMTPRNIGNPKYKAQEDYYDEIQSLKKELKYFKDDNSNLRARIRRLEEDNARKFKEIDHLYETTNNDSRRTSISSSTNLKQRLFKLELQLKQRETTIDEMKNDPRWTKGTELEIQNRALFSEIEKQKLEKLNFIRHDYMAAIDEEKKIAVRKLETEKKELKIENENLKKKIRDWKNPDDAEKLSPRHHNGNIDKDPFQKIEDLKELCKKYENQIEQIKDNLKQIRRERDRYHGKFNNINEDFEEIKRERDRYRQKLNRLNQEFEEERQTKSHQTTRSSPVILKKSYQNLRFDDRPKDDDYRVKTHAATVIQRSWRKHNKSHKNSLRNKTKQDAFDKQNSKMGGMVSPRVSQQKLGSKIDNLGSGTIKTRPSSGNLSNDSALKIVQAALRGYLNRAELDKTSQIQKLQHDVDDISSRQYRDSPSKFRRTPSPPMDNYRSSSTHMSGSKQNLFHDQNKLGSGSRFPMNDRESPSRLHRTPSPPADLHRSSSLRNTGSKQSLPNDKNKLGSNNRLDRDSSLKLQRPSTPSNDRHISPRQSNISLKNSKQSLKKSFNDDDDVIDF